MPVFPNRTGLCGHRVVENLEFYQRPYVIAYYHFNFAKDAETANKYRQVLLQVAQRVNAPSTTSASATTAGSAGSAISHRRVYFAVSTARDFETEELMYGFDAEQVVKMGKQGRPLIAARDSTEKKNRLELAPEEQLTYVIDNSFTKPVQNELSLSYW